MFKWKQNSIAGNSQKPDHKNPYYKFVQLFAMEQKWILNQGRGYSHHYLAGCGRILEPGPIA